MSLSAIFQVETNCNMLKLDGKLDYENASTLDTQIRSTIQTKQINHLIIDMAAIDFIGSTNLRKYYESVTRIAMDHNVRIILSGIDTSFLRVFKLFQRGPTIIEFETNSENAKNLLRINH